MERHSDSRSTRRRRAAALWTWHRVVGRQFVVGLALVIAGQTALAQEMYRITPLGYLNGYKNAVPYAAGFNAADEVAGYASISLNGYHAFLWRPDGHPMIDLGPGNAGLDSYASGLNASGQVTGAVTNRQGTFAFSFVASGDGTPMTRIYDNFGGNFARANGINDLGQLTGEAAAADGTTHVFLWKNDGSPMRDLGALCCDWPHTAGEAINAAGQIAGGAYYGDVPGSQAFVWENSGKPLRPLGNQSGAHLINASGQVAGVTLNAHGRGRAFLWKNDGTPIKDLGTLGGAESFPSGLNDAGQVVGTSNTLRFLNAHAFIWMNDGRPMKDLGTLGGHYSGAVSVNASGQVVGYSYLAGDAAVHTFLWRNDGGKMLDVNSLIDPTDPLKPYITLDGGLFQCCVAVNLFINDSGDLLSEGVDSRTGRVGLYLLQGTVLALAPRTLSLGNQPIHSSGGAQVVTVTNTSSKVFVIASIAVSGSAQGQFASTNNCGSSLPGHAKCTISVKFQPTSKGAKSAFLNVNGGGGGLRSVTLAGTGI